MSNFIFIAPEGWTSYVLNDISNAGMTLQALQDDVNRQNYMNSNEVLTNAGVLTDGYFIIDMKILQDDDLLWVLLTK